MPDDLTALSSAQLTEKFWQLVDEINSAQAYLDGLRADLAAVRRVRDAAVTRGVGG